MHDDDYGRIEIDIKHVNYVRLLRATISEAYIGIVSGFNNTPKVDLLLPHVPSMLELAQRCQADSEWTGGTVKLTIHVLNGVADASSTTRSSNSACWNG
ncbi:hypothetical protein C8Q70DRAFT_1055949 [Cubamyces menziesii]|nr:hypothetical protein C8Q70DRAFT_1055949 [Cubamyces menziesii]